MAAMTPSVEFGMGMWGEEMAKRLPLTPRYAVVQQQQQQQYVVPVWNSTMLESSHKADVEEKKSSGSSSALTMGRDEALAGFQHAIEGIFHSTMCDTSHHESGRKFRGVTKHKRTQRYEAHIWESKKQIYLGGFESELLAARSHDVMALKCKGLEWDALNFDRADYDEVIQYLNDVHKDDIIYCLRNYSKSFGHSSGAHVPHRMQYKLSITKKSKPVIKTKKSHPTTPMGNSICQKKAPITPTFASSRPQMDEERLFDPYQPVDELCPPTSVFSTQQNALENEECLPGHDDLSQFNPFDHQSYILESFSSDTSRAMDPNPMYGTSLLGAQDQSLVEADSMNMELIGAGGALHDDILLSSFFD